MGLAKHGILASTLWIGRRCCNLLQNCFFEGLHQVRWYSDGMMTRYWVMNQKYCYQFGLVTLRPEMEFTHSFQTCGQLFIQLTKCVSVHRCWMHWSGYYVEDLHSVQRFYGRQDGCCASCCHSKSTKSVTLECPSLMLDLSSFLPVCKIFSVLSYISSSSLICLFFVLCKLLFSSAMLFVLKSVPWTWQRAYSAAQKDLALELTDCWFDLIPAVLSEEWNVCRKGNYSISSSLSAGDPKGLHYWTFGLLGLSFLFSFSSSTIDKEVCLPLIEAILAPDDPILRTTFLKGLLQSHCSRPVFGT